MARRRKRRTLKPRVPKRVKQRTKRARKPRGHQHPELVGLALLALGVFLAGCGRLVSIRKVGLPRPTAVWLGYLIPELTLPIVIALFHHAR